MTAQTITDNERVSALVRIDARTELLTETLRADYEDALATGECQDLDDYLGWVRRIILGEPHPMGGDAR